ncbi:MAG: hypothetical protein OXI24_18000 [Candidatus Poribacteria bacterium]|nr:hypothetical protein [Candidatus Poribacteria bacterium]
MSLTFTLRFVGIWIVIFAMVLANAPVATAERTSNNSSDKTSNRTEAETFYLSTLVILGTVGLGNWLTPLDDWQAEIHKLKQDEAFIERWMLLYDDAASLEKAKKAITKIQERRKALEKKYNRWKWLYYPAVGIVGASAVSLLVWLTRD